MTGLAGVACRIRLPGVFGDGALPPGFGLPGPKTTPDCCATALLPGMTGMPDPGCVDWTPALTPVPTRCWIPPGAGGCVPPGCVRDAPACGPPKGFCPVKRLPGITGIPGPDVALEPPIRDCTAKPPGFAPVLFRLPGPVCETLCPPMTADAPDIFAGFRTTDPVWGPVRVPPGMTGIRATLRVPGRVSCTVPPGPAIREDPGVADCCGRCVEDPPPPGTKTGACGDFWTTVLPPTTAAFVRDGLFGFG